MSEKLPYLNLDSSLALIKVIQDDIENEANSIDGEFTGRRVAKMFGELMAEVMAIAQIVQKSLEREKERHGKD